MYISQKYQPRQKNQYLDYLISPSIQGVNRISVLSFENDAHQTSHKIYFLPTVEI